MPTAAITAPTDRSMLRVTMIRTIPVAMIATTDVWTDRFHRFRGVRNVWLGVMIWKRIQMIARATSIPTSRASISADRSTDLMRTGLGRLLPVGSLSCRCRPGRGYLGLSQSASSYATEACAPHGPQPVRGACRERSGFGQR